jgi:putative endonuclease
MTYYFYILYSKKLDKFYLGHTKDLDDRLRRHNSHHKGFTGKANDWKIIYSEHYSSKQLAYNRELTVKKWKNREMIEQLISSAGSVHPGFMSGGSLVRIQ